MDEPAPPPEAESASPISEDELRTLIKSIGQLAAAAHVLNRPTSQLPERIEQHLGIDPATVPSVSRAVPPVDRPNLQLAMNQILEDQPNATLIGLSPELGNYGGFSLSAIIAGRFEGPSHEVPPVYNDLPIDVDKTLRCLAAGLWLLVHDGVPIVVGLAPGTEHGPPGSGAPQVEVFAADLAVAESFTSYLQDLREQHNVYRGKVLSFSFSQYGEFGVTFSVRPTVLAEDVILPEADLESIRRHTIGIEQRASQLRAAGQDLKRGLLLHGPPGSGKTHTVGYLMAAMPERTVVLLQGPSIGALGQGAAIVRALAPAMLVIEDVDLIAADRGMYGPHEGNPLLFQLLNEMDGLTPSDDVLFVLTTNRREVLEEALANRPGRIDHAVKIDLPDADGRRRLLDLYLSGVSNEIEGLAAIVDRIEGVTASYVKELIRRATFEAIEDLGDAEGTPTITDRHLHTAIDALEQYTPAVQAGNPMGTDQPFWGEPD